MSDETATEDSDTNSGASAEVGRPAAPVVNWDDSQMRTTYANVVNAASTREEVTLFFGTNQTWNPSKAKEFNVRLEERVVLNPHAAKRLFVLLGATLAQYEKQFGKLGLDGLEAAAAAARAAANGKDEG